MAQTYKAEKMTLHFKHRRPFAEEALEKAGERLPLQQPSKSWLPFGPGYGTLWPPAKTELLTQ